MQAGDKVMTARHLEGWPQRRALGPGCWERIIDGLPYWGSGPPGCTNAIGHGDNGLSGGGVKKRRCRLERPEYEMNFVVGELGWAVKLETGDRWTLLEEKDRESLESLMETWKDGIKIIIKNDIKGLK